MNTKRQITDKNGRVKHIPVSYKSDDQKVVTVAVSIKKPVAERLNSIAREQGVSRSSIVQSILEKGLK